MANQHDPGQPTSIKISGKVKNIPLNILVRPVSEDNPNEPFHLRLVGFDEGMTDVYFSLQMFVENMADILRIQADMPTEGFILEGILLVPCTYLARIFPEMGDEIIDMRDDGLKYMLAIMPAEGEA